MTYDNPAACRMFSSYNISHYFLDAGLQLTIIFILD